MKIFCTFPYFCTFFAPSDSRYSNSCILTKDCPILTNLMYIHGIYLFSFCIMHKSEEEKKTENPPLTLKAGFVVQGHILNKNSTIEDKTTERTTTLFSNKNVFWRISTFDKYQRLPKCKVPVECVLQTKCQNEHQRNAKKHKICMSKIHSGTKWKEKSHS